MISIKKFADFLITESAIEPETILDQKLDEIEHKLNKLFELQEMGTEDMKKFSETEESESKPSDAFKHLHKDSLERSKFSKTYKNLKLIFSDELFRYDLTLSIDLEKATSQDGQSVDPETIEDCQAEIKRYSIDDDSKMVGRLRKDIKIDDINEELFEELLTELEKKQPTDNEVDEWGIETE
jgi:hypothetical protein